MGSALVGILLTLASYVGGGVGMALVFWAWWGDRLQRDFE